MDQVVIINRNELKAVLSEICKEILAELFDEIKRAHPPEREIMTLEQLASRWQVSKQSLLNWIKREENPLPVHYVGGNPRFHLVEVDAWSKMEAVRRLNK